MSSLMNDIRFQKRWGLVIAHQIERSGDVQNYDVFSKIWLSFILFSAGGMWRGHHLSEF